MPTEAKNEALQRLARGVVHVDPAQRRKDEPDKYRIIILLLINININTVPLVELQRGVRRVSADLVGRGELLVRDVAAPVLGYHRRVDDGPDRGRTERYAQVLAREPTYVQPEVEVRLPLAFPPCCRKKETRCGRVLAPRRNGRPDYLQILGE